MGPLDLSKIIGKNKSIMWWRIQFINNAGNLDKKIRAEVDTNGIHEYGELESIYIDKELYHLEQLNIEEEKDN